MGLWAWLFGSKEKKGVFEPESLRFVRNLCERNEPKIFACWVADYIYEFSLLFQEDSLRIDIEYNTISKSWDMKIWNSRSASFMYYYDCLSLKPSRTINYLLDRYNFCNDANEAIKQDQQRKDKLKNYEQQLKEKYL